ncbi:MAG: four helix bundle protein [Saprospiraceae bacterium]
MKSSVLHEKSLAFAIKIVRFLQRLRSEKKEYVLTDQLLRSGTSPGATLKEVEYAQSKRDFVNKMSISLKEINEVQYFLLLLFKTDYLIESEFNILSSDSGEIKAMVSSSIKTAKTNLGIQVIKSIVPAL